MIDEDSLKHKGKNQPIHHRVGTEHCVRCSPAHHHHHKELRGHSQPGPAEVWPIASSMRMGTILKMISCSKKKKRKDNAKHVLKSSSHQGRTGINLHGHTHRHRRRRHQFDRTGSSIGVRCRFYKSVSVTETKDGNSDQRRR